MAAILILSACGSNENNANMNTARDSAAVNQSDHTAVDSTTQQAQNTQNRMDTARLDKQSGEFAMEASSGGMMEVTLGQTAQQQAASQRVKDFGSMMVRDHSKANDELKSILQAKNFMVPASLSKDHQRHVDDLTKKQGTDFDKAYMKMMVKDHEEDIRKFEKAANNATDTAIKGFASRTLPILRIHLDSAKAINKQL